MTEIQSPAPRRSRCAFALRLATVFLTASCASNVDGNPPEPNTEVTEEGLLGDLTVGSGCIDQQKQYLQQMAFVARTVVASQAFEQCMASRITAAPYLPCATDPQQPFLDKVLRASRNVNKVNINCDHNNFSDGRAFSATGDAWNNYNTDDMTAHVWLDQVFLEVGSLGSSADDSTLRSSPTSTVGLFPEPWAGGGGLVLHEALHQNGYGHWDPPIPPSTEEKGCMLVPSSSAGPCTTDANCGPVDADGVRRIFCAKIAPELVGPFGNTRQCYRRFDQSMPYIAGSCVQRVLRDSQSVCGGGFCAGRNLDDLQSCMDSGKLSLINGFNPPANATCSIHSDPNKKGKGLLRFNISDLRALDTVPTGQRYGSGWLTNASDSYHLGTGNIEPSLAADEFVVKSGWGYGVIGVNSSSRFTSVALAANGSALPHWGDSDGFWTLQSSQQVLGVGRLSTATPTRDEILISSGQALGLLTVTGGALRTRNVLSAGTVVPGDFGHWVLDPLSNGIRVVGDVNGDGLAEILVSSSWGKALLSRTGPSGSFKTIDITAAGAAWGSWATGTNDVIMSTGDFNGDGRSDLLVKSGWGMGLIGMPAGANRLTSLWLAGFGTQLQNWTLNSADLAVDQAGRLFSKTRDSVLLRGASSLGVLSFGTGTAPSAFVDSLQRISESGRFPGVSGSWVYSSTNTIRTVGDYTGGGFASFVIRSPWGVAIIGRDNGSSQLKVQTIRNFDCGDSDDTACHGQLWGSWLARETDQPVLRLRSGQFDSFGTYLGDYLMMRSD